MSAPWPEIDRLVGAVRAGAGQVHVVNAEDDLERLLAAVRLHRPDVVLIWWSTRR